MINPAASGRPRHIEALTGLRGVAALFVVVYHLSGGFLPHLGLAETTALLQKGYLAVDLFFLLSGFVMMHVYGAVFGERLSAPDLKRFALARIARLYPLHAAMLFGFLLLELAKFWLLAIDPALPDVDAFTGGRTLWAFISHATMTQGLGLFEGPTWNGPAWSIGAEWVAYLMLPALVFALARRGPGLRLALVTTAALGLLALSGGGTLDITYNGGLWRCLAEFLLGVLLYEVYASRRLAACGADGVAWFTLGCLALAFHAGLADLLVLPLLALLILSLAHNEGLAARMFSGRKALFLGAVSYAVYLSHVLLIEIANLSSRAITGAPLGAHLGQAGSVAVLVLGPALVVAVAYGLHVLVELPGRAAILDRRAGIGRGGASERAR